MNITTPPMAGKLYLPPDECPIDLWNTIGAPSYPQGLLPKVIDDFAIVMAERYGASASGLAMSALTVMAAAIPDHVKLQPKVHDPSWLESARIWTVLVGDPSTKKSPILSAAVSPLAQIDASMVRNWKVSHDLWSALPKEERANRPEPIQERLRIEDTTVEAAQEVLKGSKNGILCVQDELSGWFGAMEKYGSGKGAALDRSFWLRAFNGGEYCLNRIGRGTTLIDNCSISLLGGIQPEPIRKVASSAVDDGLLQRMFPIMLNYSGVGLDAERPPAQDVYNFTVMMLNHVKTNGKPLRFDEDAQLLWRQRERRHNELMAAELVSKKFASHIGKYDGLFARLCIVWHAVESVNVSMRDGILPPIVPYETAERVAQFMEKFLMPHAACFYSMLGLSDDFDRVKALAEHILAKKLVEVTIRDVQRATRQLRGLKKHEILPVLQQLVALNWLAEIPGPRAESDPKFLVNWTAHELYAGRGERERERREQAQKIMQDVFKR